MYPDDSGEDGDDDNSCQAVRQKPKLVKSEHRSILRKVHDRHLNHSSKVMPDAHDNHLETVPEAEFETLNIIASRKSLLFLDLATNQSHRPIAPISPKISSKDKALKTIPISNDTDTSDASSAAAMDYSSLRSRAATFDGVVTRGIDKRASTAVPLFSPYASRRNHDPKDDLPRSSTSAQRVPSAKLRSPSVQAAPNHRALTGMFGASSSPRSDTMSPRTSVCDDVAIASPSSSITLRKGSPLSSQKKKPIAAVHHLSSENLRSPPFAPFEQTPSKGLLTSLFGPVWHREQSSRIDFEQENAHVGYLSSPSQSQCSQKSDVSIDSMVVMLGVRSAPAARDENVLNPLPALVPSPCAFDDESASPAAMPKTPSILTILSRNCSIGSIASLILPAPAVSLLASLFGSLSISEKENDQSPIDQVIAQSTLSQSQKSIGSTASLVNPSALKGLGLGRRSSFMTPRTPHPIEEHEDDTKKNPSSVVASSSDPLQAVVATDDTDDHDDMSFDTAPFDIDDYFKDPAPAPVPTGVPSPWMTPAVLNPPQHASKPIWLTHESTEQRGDERDHVNNNNNNNNSNNRMLGKPTATLLARGTAAALHPRVSRTSRTQATADEKKSSGRKGGGTAHAHEYLKKGEGVTATATATAKLQADGPYKKRKKMTQL